MMRRPTETEWEIAYWEFLAKNRKRFWLLDGSLRHWKIFLGSDEVNRRTLVVGPLVVALWQCRCEFCTSELTTLEAILEQDPIR